MNKDLTVGKPSTVLWKFCLPLFGSVVFQQLYNIADSLIAGKFIGENALAAVGNSYEITLVFIAVAFGCNIGCSVVVSRLFGAKKISEMKTAVSTSAIACATVCLFLMAAGFLTSGGVIFDSPLLKLINTKPEIFSDSELYLRIYIIGLPFMFFYNISNGIFSALGDSKTPFIFLALSSSANVGMDILFIKCFGMGVDGVAWATFICQGVSCILAVIVILKRLSGMKTETKPKAFSKYLLKDFARIAVPSTLQQSFISVGNIIIQGVVNSFGVPCTAGYSAAIKLNNLIITSFVTIGNGFSNYTSQNLGACKPERINAGFKAGLKLVWTIGLPVAALYFFASEPLVRLFMDSPTDAAVNTGITFLKIVSPFYLMIPIKLVADGALRGAGIMGKFMASTFTDLILRVALAVVLSGIWGETGIWVAWPIGWFVSVVMSYLFFKNARWNEKTEKSI